MVFRILTEYFLLTGFFQITLDAFIPHMNETIVDRFVNNKNSPLKSLTNDWVLRLSDEDLDTLCREDERIVERRSVLRSEIERLQGALAIVNNARQKTADLEKY